MKLIDKTTGAVVKSYNPTDSGILQAMMDGRRYHKTHVLVTDSGTRVDLHSHGGYPNVPKWN